MENSRKTNAHVTLEESPIQHRSLNSIRTSEPYLDALFEPFIRFPFGTPEFPETSVPQNIQLLPQGQAWPQSFQPDVDELNRRNPLEYQQFSTDQLLSAVATVSDLNSHFIDPNQVYPNIHPSHYQYDDPFAELEGTTTISGTAAAKPARGRKKETENETMTSRLSGKRNRIKSEPVIDHDLKMNSEVTKVCDEESKGNKKQRVAPKFWSTEEDKAMLDGVMEAMHGKWTVVAQHPDLANRDANRCTMRMKSLISRILKNPERKE